MIDLDDPLLFLRPDYLRLMLTYQKVEDYLFQHVYGYLRFGHHKSKDELQQFKNKSLNELKDFFFTSFEVRGLSLNEKHYLGRQLNKTVELRNYYTHQFFSDVYFKAYENGKFDKDKLEDIDFNLMDEVNRLEEFYEKLTKKFGKHQNLALRNFDISELTASFTYAHLDIELRKPAYANEREEAFAQYYWNLAYGYFALEASLFSIVDLLENHFHFLDKGNSETLQNKSFNEYRKLLLIAVKKDPLINIMINDSLSDLNTFAKHITALQEDRNYWLHFCLIGYIGNGKDFDFSAYCQSVENYDKLAKSISFLEKEKTEVFQDSLHIQ